MPALFFACAAVSAQSSISTLLSLMRLLLYTCCKPCHLLCNHAKRRRWRRCLLDLERSPWQKYANECLGVRIVPRSMKYDHD